MTEKFTAKDFDPAVALANANTEIKQGAEYEDLNSLRSEVHKQGLKASSSKMQEVLGPAGIPLAREPKQRQLQGRRFEQDQGPLAGKQKRLRNVLLRMEEIEGPLAVLRRCRDTSTRVKVYTRSHSFVRSVITGFVVAFDKYWNLVLKDVEEVFQRKMRYKAPSLGNVDKYVSVGDLSIKSEDEFAHLGGKRTPECVWHNPFREPGGSERSPISKRGTPHDFRGSSDHRFETKFRSTRERTECQKGPKSLQGLRIDEKSLVANTSRAQDYTMLQRNDPRVRSYEAESKKGEKKKDPQEATRGRESFLEQSQGLEESPQSDEVEICSEERKKTRRRKKRKFEIRERRVKQLLVRGETVVLVSPLQL